MKKILLGVVALASFALISCKKENAELKIGVSADYPPYMFLDESDKNKLTGFEIDMFDEVAKRMKKTVRYENVSFDSLLNMVVDKKVDAAIASLSITKERQAKVDFSIPYVSTGFAFVVVDPSIQEIDDLSAKVIGVQAGTSYEDVFLHDVSPLLSSLDPAIEKNNSDLIQKLKGGEIHGIFTGKADAEAFVKANNDLRILPINLKDEDNFAVAFPKASELQKDVDATLSAMITDGTMKKLKTKWLLD
ncbi:MAG: amino acid ABC transporter substrate-binding protein [Proteobacteria bacterium]|nr:amino acid ABC transporter substrate-binding protein [Pseudomonadota bacterium]